MSNELSKEDMENFRNLMIFKNKIVEAIKEVFGILVSKEACNALYIVAESMYNNLSKDEAQYVYDRLQQRLKTIDTATSGLQKAGK